MHQPNGYYFSHVRAYTFIYIYIHTHTHIYSMARQPLVGHGLLIVKVS
jgi:hypothetical protein